MKKMIYKSLFATMTMTSVILYSETNLVSADEFDDLANSASFEATDKEERLVKEDKLSEQDDGVETVDENGDKMSVVKDEGNSIVTEENDVTEIHEWQGTSFGQSSSKSVNTVIENEDGSVTLNSATFDPETEEIDKKGGKFTDFHDGLSYYYTEIDPETENFELSATFHIDYLNPNLDGQEGFGIIARDRIGEDGVSNNNYESNSAGVVMSRFKINGEGGNKRGLIGSRFVEGVSGDDGNVDLATSNKDLFIHDEELRVEQGKDYFLKLVKDNTGFRAIYIDENEEEYTHTMYDWEKLLVQDTEKIYVGLGAARGVNVTARDIVFKVTNPLDDAPAEPEPPKVITPKFSVNSPKSTGDDLQKIGIKSNTKGTIKIVNEDNDVVFEKEIIDNYEECFDLNLVEGLNEYQVVFKPSDQDLPDNIMIENTDPIDQSIEIVKKSYTGYTEDDLEGTFLYVTSTGQADGEGTKENPLDILTAISHLQKGQTIVLEGGLYELSNDVHIKRYNDGSADEVKSMITIGDDPAVFDFTQGGAFKLDGNYWSLQNIHVRNTKGDVKGLTVGGSYNHLSHIMTYNNGDTGLQISGSTAEHPDFWPTNNIVEYAISFNNEDPGHNNADGFAAKITVGEGNVFRHTVAFNNVDDGYDLYAKRETGPIGAVTIENSIAFNNGTTSDGNVGDGNGFKIGGDGINVPHILRNSLAYGNDEDGVTSNSNPGVIIENVVSMFNGGTNLAIYGQAGSEITAVLKNFISLEGQSPDRPGKELFREDATNYLDGVNSSGEKVTIQAIEKVTDLLTEILEFSGNEVKIKYEASSEIEYGEKIVVQEGTPMLEFRPVNFLSNLADEIFLDESVFGGISQIVHVGNQKRTEKYYIQNETIIEETDSLYIGETNVKEPGSLGWAYDVLEYEIDSETGEFSESFTVVETVVLEKPKNKVVLQGTKEKEVINKEPSGDTDIPDNNDINADNIVESEKEDEQSSNSPNVSQASALPATGENTRLLMLSALTSMIGGFGALFRRRKK